MSNQPINPNDYVVTPDTPISDIDLETEDFTLRAGHRLTNELAEQIEAETVDEIRRRNLIPGGKSLSGSPTHSPVIQVRLPASALEALENQAEKQHKSKSALARLAILDYLYNIDNRSA